MFSLEDNGCCFLVSFFWQRYQCRRNPKKSRLSHQFVSLLVFLSFVSSKWICLILFLYTCSFLAADQTPSSEMISRERDRSPSFQLRSLPKAEDIELLGKWIFLRIFSWIGSGAQRVLIVLHQQQGWEFESILMNYHISQRWIGRADWCSLIDKQLQIHWDLYDVHRPRFIFFVLRDDFLFLAIGFINLVPSAHVAIGNEHQHTLWFESF